MSLGTNLGLGAIIILLGLVGALFKRLADAEEISQQLDRSLNEEQALRYGEDEQSSEDTQRYIIEQDSETSQAHHQHSHHQHS